MKVPGRLLHWGRDTQVFEYREGLVLRRYPSPRPTHREAAVMDQGVGSRRAMG
ncbi:MAG: hypothetical protein M3N51_09265 [Actinomycetota bacterium]|nr:hypothetical protein [Actinomycetota bacterium]